MRSSLAINWFGRIYLAIGLAVLALHLSGFEVVSD